MPYYLLYCSSATYTTKTLTYEPPTDSIFTNKLYSAVWYKETLKGLNKEAKSWICA